MPEAIMLQHGIHRLTGELVNIHAAANGLACDSLCPGCNQELVAVQPKSSSNRRAHYRHRADIDEVERECSNTGGAQETIVHILTKNLLAKQNTLYLPPILREHPKYRGFPLTPYQFAPSQQWEVSNGKVEDRDLSPHYTPDASLDTPFGKLAVEVKVSHAVDTPKLEKMTEDGLYVLEIDVSDLDETSWGSTEVLGRTDKTKFSRWLVLPTDRSVASPEEKQHVQDEHARIDELITTQQKEADIALALELAHKKRAELEKREQERIASQVLLHKDIEINLREGVGKLVSLFLTDMKVSPLSDIERKMLKDSLRQIETILNARFSGPTCQSPPESNNLRAVPTTYLTHHNLIEAVQSRNARFRAHMTHAIVDNMMHVNGADMCESLYQTNWNGLMPTASLRKEEAASRDVFKSMVYPAMENEIMRAVKNRGVNTCDVGKLRELIKLYPPR